MENIVLEAKSITKYFPGVLANDHINFDLYKGEIHSLLGENGAGKTTLMNIFDGIYSPNEGDIFIEGKHVNIRSAFDAMKLGIGMIHQHFMLVDTLTVLENVILGLQKQGFLIDKADVIKKIKGISDKYDFKLNPNAKIWQLSVGEQQRVEIIKMLYKGANILILDEPTAVLTPQESEVLFGILKQIKSEGKPIIFISHKLEEVMEISDRITVLRKGKVVGTVNKEDVSQKDLALMMIGREILFRLERKPLKMGREILKVDNLEGYSDRGIKTLREVSFNVHSGEIFGIAGVAGNGQEELAESITGLRKSSKGKIFIDSCDMTNLLPYKMLKKGVNYIPADRIRTGLIPNLSSVENAILRCYTRKPVSKNFTLDFTKAKDYANKIITEFNIMVPRLYAPVKLLSGGNMQKLLLAREILEDPILLIAVHPTRGLDIGATEFVRKKLIEARDKGAAVLLISEDLDEILMISDRIGVIYDGRIVGLVDSKNAQINDIGLMMGGSKNLNVEKW
ncbi:MAG: heme ABC transporter ATP-binding protein [Caldiserica bacterium CG_4_8_14_3_um_filter_35_18]|nr:ABC transporter ATP-binding protein [Caldisericota bacterium]PIW10178.1 MAG: heme ABC transporter ATP-binding protein [Caldiserica bacterium CG17_big_fil_post_rev_8_21_14_2_50_35_7]PIX28763.1 MAG: heme ABC transporter ATP-binding protein [Caldiserica bacterium CG_4_8_14_3_um_filter_35_18]